MSFISSVPHFKTSNCPVFFVSKKAGASLFLFSFLFVVFPVMGWGYHGGWFPGILVSASVEKSYLVQLNSFKGERNAQRFITAMKKRGYSPFLEKGKKGDGWHHVRIGPYPSREDANAVAMELKKKEGLSAFVLVSMSLDENSSVATDIAPETGAVPEAKAEERAGSDSHDSGDAVDVVLSRFLLWLKAWQNRDVESYLDFYSNEFEQSLGTMQEWKKTRRQAFRRNGNAKIEIRNVGMEEIEGTVKMSFIQNFQSEMISDVGRKTLIWKFDNGLWQIIRETWEPV